MTRQQFEDSEMLFFLNHNRTPQDDDYTSEQLDYINKVMQVEGVERLKAVLLAHMGGKEIPISEQAGCCGGKKKHFKKLLEEYKKRTLSV